MLAVYRQLAHVVKLTGPGLGRIPAAQQAKSKYNAGLDRYCIEARPAT